MNQSELEKFQSGVDSLNFYSLNQEFYQSSAGLGIDAQDVSNVLVPTASFAIAGLQLGATIGSAGGPIGAIGGALIGAGIGFAYGLYSAFSKSGTRAKSAEFARDSNRRKFDLATKQSKEILDYQQRQYDNTIIGLEFSKNKAVSDARNQLSDARERFGLQNKSIDLGIEKVRTQLDSARRATDIRANQLRISLDISKSSYFNRMTDINRDKGYINNYKQLASADLDLASKRLGKFNLSGGAEAEAGEAQVSGSGVNEKLATMLKSYSKIYQGMEKMESQKIQAQKAHRSQIAKLNVQAGKLDTKAKQTRLDIKSKINQADGRLQLESLNLETREKMSTLSIRNYELRRQEAGLILRSANRAYRDTLFNSDFVFTMKKNEAKLGLEGTRLKLSQSLENLTNGIRDKTAEGIITNLQNRDKAYDNIFNAGLDLASSYAKYNRSLGNSSLLDQKIEDHRDKMLQNYSRDFKLRFGGDEKIMQEFDLFSSPLA